MLRRLTRAKCLSWQMNENDAYLRQMLAILIGAGRICKGPRPSNA